MGLLSRLMGKGEAGKAGKAEPDTEEVEYEGFLIKPAPLQQKGNYVTAGYVKKLDDSGEMREHYFIRADTHADFEAACKHAVFKGQQIIRESGERIFDKR